MNEIETAAAKKTARATGLWYLALAIAGILGFLVIRGQLFVEGDAAATAANLVEREGLARLGIGAEMTMIVAQAFVALWFYRLFRGVSVFAAGSLTVFGFANVVVGLVGTVFSATGLGVALGEFSAPGGDSAGTAQLLYELRDSTWSVGGLFFGLWLVPMGYLVIKSGFMPRLIGYLLLIDAVAYFVGAYLVQAWPGGPASVTEVVLMVVPGEFVILLYLLIVGVRAPKGAPKPRA